MKEFWVYTALRGALFVATFAVVFGIWLALTGEAPAFWVAVISFVLSGIGSYFLLGRQREALAQHVDQRARRATSKIEERRSKEDAD